MPEFTWNRPVLSIFKEREKPESEPFVVIRAREVMVNQTSDLEFCGFIKDFYTLMGDADYLSSPEGKEDHYVICWFDDTEPDMSKDFRKLRGAKFNKIVCNINEQNHKRTYNAQFTATQGKLE